MITRSKVVRVAYALLAALIFISLVSPVVVVAATLDIDRGSDTGVHGWSRITQWLNDRFYGVGKVSYEVSSENKALGKQGVQEQTALINMPYEATLELAYDFPEAEIQFVRNVSVDNSLFAVTTYRSDVIGGFWEGLKSALGFSADVTLANRDYISNIYMEHTLALWQPETDKSVADMAADNPNVDRLSLKKPTQVGMTTAEIREHYGVNNISLDGDGIKVAILDTGLFNSTEYLAYGSNFFVESAIFADNSSVDYNGHGSHVASILAGANVTIDDVQFEGIAPKATVYAIRVLDARGAGIERDIIRGVERAIELDVDIISMSLGGNMPAYSGLYDVIQKARSENIVIVAAAGNDGGRDSLAPAKWDGVISVGSLDSGGYLSFFSNLNFDVAAIGQDVTAPAFSKTAGRFTWLTLSGTSMATPVVSGLLALYLEANPLMKGRVNQITSDIAKSGDYINPLVPGKLFTIATWWNDYYYAFPEFDLERLIDNENGAKPSRSNEMTFTSVDFWRALGKQP